MIENIKPIIERYAELESLMSSPDVACNPKKIEELGKEYNSLSKYMPTLRQYVDITKKLSESRNILKTESDPDLLEIADEDVKNYETQLQDLEEKVKTHLVPPNPEDSKNAIVEIRAGTGGVEAGLFAGVLYRMYTHYAESKDWPVEILSFSDGELGGIKEIIFMIKGAYSYGALKFESGVHRVQRVPQTEAQGRIHTSAASVAVFPEADDIEIDINPNDLRIDVFRSSGPGGQSVNTTDSAVRIVHIPTGLTVTCQDEKSQHKNKAKAMKVLQSRLYDMKLEEKEAKESASRRSMISTGDRSVKIRTYNFPQGRVTDHRINLTLYKLEEIVNGNLQDIIDALLDEDRKERLKDIKDSNKSKKTPASKS